MAAPVLIDTHMHIYPTKDHGHRQKGGGYVVWEYGDKPELSFSKIGGDLEDALSEIKRNSFTKTVVVNLFSAPGERFHEVSKLGEGASEAEKQKVIDEINSTLKGRLMEFNKWGCGITKGHPELVPYITADPNILTGDENRAHIRDMVENHGARGIKLHPVVQEFSMSDERMWPVYETCVELGIPIVAHSGPARGGEKYGIPQAFAGVLKAFPDLTMVLAHMGGGTWQQSLEIAQTYPNAYFDCCEIMEWMNAPSAPTPQQMGETIKAIGTDRVFMGSDFPWYDLDHSVDLVSEMPGLSAEQKEAVLGQNAISVLNL